jgi:hypothetical protein
MEQQHKSSGFLIKERMPLLAPPMALALDIDSVIDPNKEKMFNEKMNRLS